MHTQHTMVIYIYGMYNIIYGTIIADDSIESMHTSHVLILTKTISYFITCTKHAAVTEINVKGIAHNTVG